jgi:predicted TIM-barrel fold metal-dependent hydrolase
MPTNQQWLEQVTEEIIEPDLPICDPHHHLGDYRKETVEPRYLLDELLVDINSGHNIVSTVFIECGTMFKADGPDELKPVGETEFVNGVAAMSASGHYGECRIAAGIIGTAYLWLGDPIAGVLDAQIAAGGGRFRGLRQGASWDASPEVPNHRTEPASDMYLNAKFREGFKHLAQRQLTFEGWCYHPQIPALTDLARTFPETTIILDHFGGPLGVGPYAGKADEVYTEWKKAITALADCPNVMAKLGGLAMPVNGFAWHAREQPPTSTEFMDAQRRYFDTTLELFGVERCMFESNFPVDKVSVSYAVMWNAFKRYVADYSDAEKLQLFHDTATRVYRL